MIKTNRAFPETLLLCWYFLLPRKSLKEQSNPHFIRESFYLFQDYKVIHAGVLPHTLSILLEIGVIEELFIEKNINDNEKDTIKLIQTFHYTTKSAQEMCKVSTFLQDYLLDEIFIWSYRLRINKDKAKEYISEYLHNWRKDNFFLLDQNFYKSEKQLSIIIQNILNLLKDYPPGMLLVYDVCDKKIDFIASLLFLESIECIQLLELTFVKHDGRGKMAVRLNVKDEILHNFIKKQGSSEQLTAKNTKKNFTTVHYKQTITNATKNKLYYKDSEEKFLDGPSRRMWLFFIQNAGYTFDLKQILEKVRPGLNFDGNKDLREILMNDRKNMIKKISSIGIQRKEVNSWLIEEKNGKNERWGLEPEKGSIR